MSVKALVFATAGAIVGMFYAFESFLSFQANGFTPPLLVKLLICVAGIYFSWRNARQIKASRPGGSSADST